MDSFKKRVSRFGTITKSGQDGDEETKDTFGKKLGNMTRRLTQQARGKWGDNSHALDDTEYLERKKRIKELRKYYKDLHTNLSKYLNAMRSMCYASAMVGDDIERLYNQPDCPAEYKQGAQSIVSSMRSIDGETRRIMDEQFVARVLDPIDAINKHMEKQHKEMKHREYMKVDCDAHRRAVAKLKEKGTAAPAKLHEKEAEKERAEKLLNEVTQKLYADFNLVESKRYSVLVPQVNMFTKLQRDFFSQGSSTLNSVPNLPSGVAPVAIGQGGSLGLGAAANASGSSSTSPNHEAASPPVTKTAPELPSKTDNNNTTHDSAYKTAPLNESVRVIYSYTPRNPDELELVEGEQVTLTRRHDDGWADGFDSRNRKGVFPVNYTEPILKN